VKGVENTNPYEYTEKMLRNISVEISGYIGKTMFKKAIQNQKILTQDIIIGNMPLKVDNYWFCLTELLDPSPKN